MVTIYDIAQKAGVSIATVSRVLSGSNHPVSRGTRERILQIARELDFKPNTIARSLSNKKTQTIGLIVPSITNYFYTEIAQVIEDILHDKEYSVFLCSTNRNIEKETQYIQTLMARRVDGIIISRTRTTLEDSQISVRNIEELKNSGIPTVVFGSSFKDVNMIYVDTYSGAFMATKYLISLGHEKIGFINGYEVSHKKNRLEGYKAALVETGMMVDEKYILRGNLEEESGYICTQKLLLMDAPPTAIIAVNNFMAVGAIQAVKKMGYRIPQDISIIGFDDSKITEVVDPPLTVVKQPLEKIGKAAAEMLLDEINGKLTEKKKLEFKTQLIIRGSCGRREEK